MKNLKEVLAGLLVTALMMSSIPAQAGLVGTEQMLAQDARAQSLNTVQTFMAGEQVAAQFEAWGVAPDMVEARVAALSEAELQELATSIQTQPAGGDGLVIVGIVFVVLLILELVGITNVFNAI